MNNTLKITFFGFVLYLIKWILIAIGAIATYYMVSLQVQYGVTSKVISEMISPTLHPDAMEKVYMPMTNKLLDTGDITMASVVRIPVADDLSNEDIEEAMESVAIERSIRSVGMLPLSEMVELQTGEKQRYLKIYQYCSPRVAMTMVDHSDAFSAYLPCRLAVIEDKQGKKWIYTLDMDLMIYGGAPLPPELLKKAIAVQATIDAIQQAGATGDF
ncbi:hypothetical protein AZO1586I_1518 [Bathymodiolus thermophilus thioautotrophic gill symbiont]|jgi:uncharacterized protein (DUF302 family)|uniref:Protein containing DUF302 n=3 Tax=sulfur-oxidizing symbionts TaxID=32036 RepID=A0A1H6KGW3_9GAMM|nr:MULTISPECIES: DUF302 domain-containing protein [sulfur-oxidizing symbionts]CAC9427493.1 hypothetical protein [uncultured Gammaproteobacteria bacterium]CAB5502038.1 hypothetical protein AZO1586R_1369 [Bathymodiolus azoricus thioautotrophic gill symbiont]CAB5505832.1 hypothetical protein AZO1586I_1518 [Bathymodiolus thermophilus thioautotrophic gill symbiont]CAC9504184.1 hypothetical protein [uncultured Gammaproteobacteria bacterium]CAC9512772.1 hypothetical protein [uncultured Gammaproteobac